MSSEPGRHPMALKPYLQLVRLPNLFSAAADSLAGWLLVGGTLTGARQWPWLLLASVATYAGGVVLNDVFDVEVDRRERPGRPLPSGRVDLRLARALGAALMAAGLVAAALSGTRYGLPVAVALAACVLGYDAGLKHTPVGPLVMGACRGLNLLLGASLAVRLGGPAVWGVATAYAVYVAGITWISRSEVEAGSGVRRGVAWGVLLENAALLTYVAAACQPGRFPAGDVSIAAPVARVAGVVILILSAVWVGRHTFPAVRADDPRAVQRAVVASLRALVALHVGLLVAVRDVPTGVMVLCVLWAGAVLSGRWVYST